MAVELSVLRAGRILLHSTIPGIHFCYMLVNPRTVVRLEGLGKLKNNPMTCSGIESFTFRLAFWDMTQCSLLDTNNRMGRI
jgi:hypothetical protein